MIGQRAPEGLDDQREDLYSRKRQDENIVSELEGKEYDVSDEWLAEDEIDKEEGEEMGKKKKKKTSWAKTILIVSMVFFIVASFYAYYQIYANRIIQEPGNIDVVLTAPAATDSGTEVPIQLVISNRNTIALEDVELYLEFPPGTKAVMGDEESTQRLRKTIGTIEPNAVINETIYATFFGEQNERKLVLAEMEYRFSGSNPILENTGETAIVMSSSPLYVGMNVSDEAVSDQELPITITIQSESGEVMKDLLVDMDYPFGFEFIGASPEPRYGDSIWHIETLPPYGKIDIELSGQVKGEDNEEKVFKLYVGSKSELNDEIIGTILSSAEEGVQLKKSFIGLGLTLNKTSGDNIAILKSGEGASVNVSYVNNTDAKIIDAKITLRMIGDQLNRRGVWPKGGFYDSLRDEVIWDQKTTPALAVLEPGESGGVSVRIDTIPALSNGVLVENPKFSIEVMASGRRLSDVNVPEETKVPEVIEGRIRTDVGLNSRLVYNDGPIANTGPLPPVVDQETTYTAIWQITNTSNELDGVVVSSSLPTYVDFTNVVVPNDANISFNEVGGDIIWNVGTVPAGAGVTQDPVEVAFQIAFRPGLSQREQEVDLTSGVEMTGTDIFTNVRLGAANDELTTAIYSDSQYQVRWREVSE